MIFVKQKKAWSSLVPRWLLASPYLLPFWEFRCGSLIGSVANLCGKLSASSCACALSCPFISGGLITKIHYLYSSISGPNSHFEHRSMTIKTLEDFVEYMRTYMVSRVKTMVTWSHVSHFFVWFIHNGKCIHWDIWLSKILQLLAEISGEGNDNLKQFCLLIFMRISWMEKVEFRWILCCII